MLHEHTLRSLANRITREAAKLGGNEGGKSILEG